MKIAHKKNDWQQAVVVSAILGVLFSGILFNVLHARAFSKDFEFESVGLGEDGPYSDICGVQFDSYLLSADKWKGRISDFAKDIFENMANAYLSYLRCNLFFIDLKIEAFGFSGPDQKGPRCTLDMKDVEAAAVDAAERQLTFDLLTKCTSTAMTEQISTNAIEIVQENGPDGGPAFVRDWHDEAPSAAQMAIKKSRNTFANTNWCPWIKIEMETLLGFSSDDAYSLNDEIGREFAQAYSCRYGDDVKLSDLEGDPTWQYQSSLPENDLASAYLAASQHQSARIAYEIELRRDRNIAYSGFQPLQGSSPEDSCIRFDGNSCVEYDLVQVPGSVVRDNLLLANQAQYALAASPDKMGEMMADFQPRMTTLMQDLTSRVLALDFELDLSTRRYQDADAGSVPLRSNPPTTRNCGQPSQTDCSCLDDPGDPGHDDAQIIARNLVSRAVGDVALRRPDLVVNGKVLLNKFADFVIAVCFELRLSQSGCRAYTSSDPSILIFPAAGLEYAIDVIRGDGTPQVTAPVNRFSCITGVLP